MQADTGEYAHKGALQKCCQTCSLRLGSGRIYVELKAPLPTRSHGFAGKDFWAQRWKDLVYNITMKGGGGSPEPGPSGNLYSDYLIVDLLNEPDALTTWR